MSRFFKKHISSKGFGGMQVQEKDKILCALLDAVKHAGCCAMLDPHMECHENCAEAVMLGELLMKLIGANSPNWPVIADLAIPVFENCADVCSELGESHCDNCSDACYNIVECLNKYTAKFKGSGISSRSSSQKQWKGGRSIGYSSAEESGSESDVAPTKRSGRSRLGFF